MSIAIVACSDTDKSVNHKNDGRPNSFGGSYSIVWNQVNPFDSVGLIHNNILDYAIGQYGGTISAETFLVNVSSHMSDYAYNTFLVNIPSDSIENSNMEFYEGMSEFIENDSLILHDYIDETFSSNISYSMNQVIEIVREYSNSSQVPGIIQQIKIIENSVALNQSYSQHEKEIVLSFTSVSKFSLVYWDEAKNNPNSQWNQWYQEYFNTDELPNTFYGAAFAIIVDAISYANNRDKGRTVNASIIKSAMASSAAYFGSLGSIAGSIWTVVVTVWDAIF